MASRGDHHICTDCGATWNETPKLGMPEVIAIDRWTGRAAREGDDIFYSPSKSTKRRAAKARGEK